MSWLDQVKTAFVITTGDKKKYTVNWLNATKLAEWNIAQFTFPNLAGSLVNKSTPLGTQYALEIYFQGDDHLDVSKAFHKSADDSRPWKIAHPFYGNILVQAPSLLFDNSDMNVTKITGTVIETITQTAPLTVVDPADNIVLDKQNLDPVSVAAIEAQPAGADLPTLTKNNAALYNSGIPIISIPADAQNYYNLFRVANSAATNLLTSPLIAMQATQALINAPANFTTSVKAKVNLLSVQFNALRSNFTGLNPKTPASPFQKQVYQMNATSNLSAQCVAAATPASTDYSNMAQALYIINIIINNYNQFIVDLDGIQTNNGGAPSSFIPDANSIIALNQLVNYTVSVLFQIALQAKQERSIILTVDSNVILLTHQLYGLDEFDANIDALIVNNGWGLNQLLEVKKGTKVLYYI